jgi:hypothetical protein
VTQPPELNRSLPPNDCKEFEDRKAICVFIGKIGRLEATYEANQSLTPNCGLMGVFIRPPQEQAREIRLVKNELNISGGLN